jgi:hypothetical protein
VVHDPVPAALPARPHARGDVVHRLVPAHPPPLALAPRADALEGVQDALGVVDLVVGGGPLGAVAPAAAGVSGVALELADRERLLVDVGEQPARALAVEADRRHERVAPRDLLRPRLAVPLHPVVPAVRRRVLGQAAVGVLHRGQRDGGLIGDAVDGRLGAAVADRRRRRSQGGAGVGEAPGDAHQEGLGLRVVRHGRSPRSSGRLAAPSRRRARRRRGRRWTRGRPPGPAPARGAAAGAARDRRPSNRPRTAVGSGRG